MSTGVIVFLILVGASVLWGFVSPVSTPALPDPERAARLRHEHAQQEIRDVEQATRQLMRAVASANVELPQQAEMVVTRRPSATSLRQTSFTGGFVWTLGPAAGNSTSTGRVTFYVPLHRANY